MGEIGFYRVDPATSVGPMRIKSIEEGSLTVLNLKLELELPISPADWMSFDEMLDKTRAMHDPRGEIHRRLGIVVALALVADRVRALREAIELSPAEYERNAPLLEGLRAVAVDRTPALRRATREDLDKFDLSPLDANYVDTTFARGSVAQVVYQLDQYDNDGICHIMADTEDDEIDVLAANLSRRAAGNDLDPDSIAEVLKQVRDEMQAPDRDRTGGASTPKSS